VPACVDFNPSSAFDIAEDFAADQNFSRLDVGFNRRLFAND
jgi:hypothetical protein